MVNGITDARESIWLSSALIKMYENQTEQKISGGNFECHVFTFQMDNITEARDGPKDFFALLEYDRLWWW